MKTKEEDIRTLLDIMEVHPGKLSSEIQERLGTLAMVSVPPDKKDEAENFIAGFFAEDPFGSRLLNAHAEAYDTRFSHIEIKDLLEFYESPIGRKWVGAIGEITKGILKANKRIVQDLIDELHAGLRDAGIIPEDEEAEAAKNRILAGVTKRLSN